jgi:lambda repressor-like predicted transcriptional regulator
MKESLDDVARLRREGRDMDAGTREAEPEMRSLREALERRRAGGAVASGSMRGY